MDPATRTAMEGSFSFDFSKVRIHADARAAASARALHARAYALGNSVVLGGSGFRPDTPQGRMLLAHELAHVVQQAGAGPGSPPPVRRTQAESEARVAGARASTGHAAVVSTPMPAHVALDGEEDRPSGTVVIAISLASNQIEFRTRQGIYRYELVHRGLRTGTYAAGVSVHENRVHLSFSGDGAAASGHWSWRIRRGQPDPATFLRGIASAEVRISDEPFHEVTSEPSTPSEPQDPNAVFLTPEEARRRCEAGDLPVMTFPLRFTRLNASHVIATREGSRIRVRMPMSSYINGRELPGMHRMPPMDVVTGILLEPHELVRVRFYTPRLNPLADDEVSETCRTGEQMLEVSAAGDRAVMMNIALTGVDALMFTPVGAAIGRGVSAAIGRFTQRVVAPGLAAAMIGTARVAEPAFLGAASRTAVTAVEQRAVAAAVETAGTQTVAQVGVQAAEYAVTGTATRAALATVASRGVGATVSRAGTGVTLSTLGGLVRNTVTQRGMRTQPAGGGGRLGTGTPGVSDIPHVQQAERMACGPACGEMASGHYSRTMGSRQVTQAGLIRAPEFSSVDGMNYTQLTAALEREAPVAGRTWQAVPHLPSGTLTDAEVRAALEAALRDGNGVAILNTIVTRPDGSRYWHWVMAREVQGGQVLIHDPEGVTATLETITADGFGPFHWTGDAVMPLPSP